MSGHSTPAELAALLRGELPPQRARSILRHLLRQCQSCLAVIAALADEAAFEEAPAVEPEAEYDAAIDRAITAVRRQERHVRAQEAQAKKILAAFERQDELVAAADIPRSTDAYAKYLALLDRSWNLRHENPARMVQLAGFAVECAKRIDPRKFGAKQVFDFQCIATTAYANAFRVAQRLDEAVALMVRARQLFELGTKEQHVEVYLLVREAGLDVARRRFKPAIDSLQQVYRYYLSVGDKHLAGRSLVQQGLYTRYAGEPEKALGILERSLALIDATLDPSLAYAALHNRLSILVDCGRYQEAKRQLFQVRAFQEHAGGHINQIKLRWEEGRIDAGCEQLERAEKTLLEVRAAMTAINRGYDAALASLDLAAVLLTRGRYPAAAEVVAVAYRTFMALQIEREGLASLLILKKAFENDMANRAMVEEVASFLRMLEIDPETKFTGKAWGAT